MMVLGKHFDSINGKNCTTDLNTRAQSFLIDDILGYVKIDGICMTVINFTLSLVK